ncbi:MAG: glycosyltransferase family 8 protein [Eubacteriales bacterium]
MISLLYCGNENVFKGLLISAVSAASKASEPLDVHVITMDLSDINPSFVPINECQAEFIEKILQSKAPGSKITVHDASSLFRAEMLDSPNMENFYTPYALLRLFADEIELPEKILYLDTDTVAYRDIAPLFHEDTKGCDFAGIRDYLGKFFINPNYINTGVLLLDMKKIRESGLFKKARHFCATKKTAFPDQDAINRLVSKKCFLKRKYNEQRRMKKDTVIRHFSKTLRLLPYFHTLNIKPWDIDGLHEKYKTYEFDDILYECLSYIEDFENNHSKN